jgi:transcriptional regulator GlxA family with amidase domain
MVTASHQTDVRIQRAAEILTEDPARPLPALALSCQVSVSRLTHLFKDEIGITVKNYRLDSRLQEAAVMLASTDMPIKAIASSVGYRHTSSFVRAFKTHCGVTPAGYRMEQRWQEVAAYANK